MNKKIDRILLLGNASRIIVKLFGYKAMLHLAAYKFMGSNSLKTTFRVDWTRLMKRLASEIEQKKLTEQQSIYLLGYLLKFKQSHLGNLYANDLVSNFLRFFIYGQHAIYDSKLQLDKFSRSYLLFTSLMKDEISLHDVFDLNPSLADNEHIQASKFLAKAIGQHIGLDLERLISEIEQAYSNNIIVFDVHTHPDGQGTSPALFYKNSLIPRASREHQRITKLILTELTNKLDMLFSSATAHKPYLEATKKSMAYRILYRAYPYFEYLNWIKETLDNHPDVQFKLIAYDNQEEHFFRELYADLSADIEIIQLNSITPKGMRSDQTQELKSRIDELLEIIKTPDKPLRDGKSVKNILLSNVSNDRLYLNSLYSFIEQIDAEKQLNTYLMTHTSYIPRLPTYKLGRKIIDQIIGLKRAWSFNRFPKRHTQLNSFQTIDDICKTHPFLKLDCQNMDHEQNLIAQLVNYVLSISITSKVTAIHEEIEFARHCINSSHADVLYLFPGRTPSQNISIEIAHSMNIKTISVEVAACGKLDYVMPHSADQAMLIDSIQKSIFVDYFECNEDKLSVTGSLNFEDFLKNFNEIKMDSDNESELMALGPYVLLVTQDQLSNDEYENFIELFAQWQIQFNSDVYLQIKMHPKENLSRYFAYQKMLLKYDVKGYIMHNSAKLENSLANAMLVVGKSSNSLLQAMQVNIPIINLPGDDITLDFSDFGFGSIISNTSEFNELINAYKHNLDDKSCKKYWQQNAWIGSETTYNQRLLSAATVN